jgi:undecaprenyl-diphosphatase
VYWKRLWPVTEKKLDRSVLATWSKVIVAVVPAIILGALFGSKIQAALFNPIIVALALIVGGIALVFLEWRRHAQSIKSIEKLSYGSAFGIGLAQCLALIPGTSRSASSILGALFLGASRQVATEFSFFLAIPTLLAASAYSLLKHGVSITSHEVLVLAVGFAVAFISALTVIRLFLHYIQSKNFLPFAYYRIALGLLMLMFFSLR